MYIHITLYIQSTLSLIYIEYSVYDLSSLKIYHYFPNKNTLYISSSAVYKNL